MTVNSHYLKLSGLICLSLVACSTNIVLPEKAPLPEVPQYVKVPHPAGFELVDLKAIFLSSMAPKAVLGEFADTCDEDFKKLIQLTPSKVDRKKGAVELVTLDPEKMHWCFYAKISKLQDTIQGDTTWTVRQKKALETFSFLGPIANAYVDVYQDSRYLRWASLYYTKISEWVFFRKVSPTPESTLTLMQNSRTDLEPWIPIQHPENQGDSIFAKFGITLTPSVASSGQTNPLNGNLNQQIKQAGEAASRAPASVTPPEDKSKTDADFSFEEK